MLLLLIILIVLAYAGPYRYYGPENGPVYGFGGAMFVLILLIVLHLSGVIDLRALFHVRG